MYFAGLFALFPVFLVCEEVCGSEPGVSEFVDILLAIKEFLGGFGGGLKELGFGLVDLGGQFLQFGIVLVNGSDQLIFLLFE